jgi:hypothetical protein
MSNETGVQTPFLHSLIPLEDFKAILGLDDREDALSRYCLVTAAYTIEQFCKRRLVLRKCTDYWTVAGDTILTLREYPVRKVLTVQQGGPPFGPENLVDPTHYYCLPDEGICEDIPFSLALRSCGFTAGGVIRVRYLAGYVPGKAPADLASACLELAAWNMTRYRGRRIGMTGNVRGSGKDGEHLEASLPENVRLLLEPYQRRVI